MNVFDFDKTIYYGDSTIDFYLYSLKKNPKIARYIFIQCIGFILYLIGIYNKTQFKEKFYIFLKGIENIDELILSFWDKHNSKINMWYIEQKESTDVIISASPEFLLKPICDELGVSLIASLVDKNNGQYYSNNCYGEEKVRRLYEKYPEACIEKFYTDSLSDEPLLKISKSGYLVKKKEVNLWNS